jgi:hypothetical protein
MMRRLGLAVGVASYEILTGKEERLAPIVRPAHEVRRSSVAANLDDLAVSQRTAERGGCHHDPVAYCCFHRCSLRLVVAS